MMIDTEVIKKYLKREVKCRSFKMPSGQLYIRMEGVPYYEILKYVESLEKGEEKA